MSTGTKIVQTALFKIGKYSPLKPTNPETLEEVLNALNSMTAEHLDDCIDYGAVPLQALGDEYSEPQGMFNTITNLLAIECVTLFPGTVVSTELARQARIGKDKMEAKYKTLEVPNRTTGETLPKGQGNKAYWNRTYFADGTELGET